MQMTGLKATDAGRSRSIRASFALEYATVGWMVVEITAAIWAGLAAHNLSLLAFGADSVIELASAGVLIWRLSIELRRGEAFSESAERLASRISGALLLLLGVYVTASAAWGLWSHQRADSSSLGLVITALAIPIMFVLGRAKLRMATALGSSALRADAVESIACLYLAGVVFLGLAAERLWAAWWIDDVTSLAVVGLVVREGLEALRGDEAADD